MKAVKAVKVTPAPGGDDTEAPQGKRDGGGIQSLERAFAILEEVARNRNGISLHELTSRVGLHNSTTFHLVKTLVSLGYVEQIREPKRYRIGRQIFTLAAAALNDIEMVGFVTPILEKLTIDTGECSHFAVRSGDNVMVLARTAASGLLQMADQVGVARPAHCTALGKVLLSACSADQLDRYLSSHELRRFTAKTIVEPEVLKREIETVGRNRMGFDDGEFDAEVRCVAVPVHDFTGRLAGAIGISGPIWRLSIQALQEKAQRVREAAAQLSRELGSSAGEPQPKAVRAKR